MMNTTVHTYKTITIFEGLCRLLSYLKQQTGEKNVIRVYGTGEILIGFINDIHSEKIAELNGKW